MTTLNEIFQMWERDSKIDPTILNHESLNTSQLHCAYYRILSNERLFLRALEMEHKQLFLQKHEFFTQGPTQESEEKGWKLPPKGCVLKNEAPLYLDADDDLNDKMILIHAAREKVNVLEDILRIIHRRSFLIRAAIDFTKFQAGE